MSQILLFVGMFLPIILNASVGYLKFRQSLSRTISPLEKCLESHDVYTVHKDKIAGYVSDAQKFQMNEVLRSYSDVKKIGEIGLNAGHSAENFFKHCNQLENYYSFEIQNITEVVEYFQTNYGNRFHFINGDSLKTVPEFAKNFPDIKFDLIFIDGAHSYDDCLQDILNMHQLAHPKSHLWIDDYTAPEVFDAVETSAKVFGILEVLKVHLSDFKTPCERCWIEARYLFPTE